MITFFIIAITAIVSYQGFSSAALINKYCLNAYAIVHRKEYWRLVSHIGVHADWGHLLFNMLTLFFFGTGVETALRIYFGGLGAIYFVIIYLVGGVFSSLYSLAKHQNNPGYNAVGASGAVSAVLFASILFSPQSKIYLFFIPIGIPAYIFGFLYLAYSAYMSKRGTDNIGHDAHFWGAIFGFCFPILLNSDFFRMFLERIF